ncbi:MAG: DUF1492 domain-containing protein [Clostridia bacterium]|nr:DUF1492 domain-containing protein [Clostridiales bacterium]MDU7504507.1 DUF1492 domain-containing protein [Clostridia bacterium]
MIYIIKEYISDFVEKRERFLVTEEKIRTLRNQSLCISSPTIKEDFIKSGGIHDSMKVVDEYIDLENKKLLKQQKEYIEAMLNFIELSNALSSERKRNIIKKRYIDQLEMKDIAIEEDITYNYCYQLEKIALQELDIILKSRKKL